MALWVSNTHLLVRSTHRVVCACVAEAHACVQFRHTHTHTHVCSLNAQARVWEQHARACVHAHDMCVCAHEKKKRRPPSSSPSPDPPVPPEPVPVTIPIPSHRSPYASPFVRASVGRKAERCSTTPGEAAGRAVRHGAHNRPSHSNILPAAQARSRTRAGGGGSEFDRKQLCRQRQQSAETYPRRLNIDSIGWASGLVPLQK